MSTRQLWGMRLAAARLFARICTPCTLFVCVHVHATPSFLPTRAFMLSLLLSLSRFPHPLLFGGLFPAFPFLYYFSPFSCSLSLSMRCINQCLAKIARLMEHVNRHWTVAFSRELRIVFLTGTPFSVWAQLSSAHAT